ncbi:MAG: VanZ family protein [Pseudomonadota bacterium]
MREVYLGVSRRLLYLIALFVLAGLLLFAPMPFTSTYFGRTIENAGHTPLFFLLTLGLIYALRDDRRLAGARIYAFAGLVGAGAGFLSEVIQRPLARDASWEDVGADVVGAILALAVYALFERRSVFRRWHRATALLVACACIALYVTPIVRMTRAYVHRNGEFPVLADFHSRLELYWTIPIGVNREIVGDALAVDLVAMDSPGVSFHEPVPDWRNFQTLLIDVANPAVEPLHLGVRVHDRQHKRIFSDRFNRRFELAAGERRTLIIPLEDVRHGPRERLMDMAHISDITLFRAERAGSQKLLVYSLRLQ